MSASSNKSGDIFKTHLLELRRLLHLTLSVALEVRNERSGGLVEL